MRVLLGITGSIAAYKSITLARALAQKGVEVKTVLSGAGEEFVTPLTIESLTQQKVYTHIDFFTPREVPLHIELAKWAEIIVIAPITAHYIGKIAHGFADDLLTSIILMSRAPIILAPAMHAEMWENRAVRENVQLLRRRGFEFLGPMKGTLSTGETGTGRMIEPEDILSHILKRFDLKKCLENKKVLIAYGRTEEPIDSVRVITNRSSGKMGVALVETAKKLGAYVIAVEGEISIPSSGSDIYEKVSTSEEMKGAIEKHIEDVDIFVMAAAVSDFKPKKEKREKIKSGKTIFIEFEPTIDILKEISSRKKPNQIFVGFALESKEKLIEDAKMKLKKKNIDMVIANDPNSMGADLTGGYIILKDGRIEEFSGMTKSELSLLIFEKVLNITINDS